MWPSTEIKMGYEGDKREKHEQKKRDILSVVPFIRDSLKPTEKKPNKDNRKLNSPGWRMQCQ